MVEEKQIIRRAKQLVEWCEDGQLIHKFEWVWVVTRLLEIIAKREDV